MAITIGKLKCFFCDKKGGFFHSVHKYGEYGVVGGRYHYHPECLLRIQENPTGFTHMDADKAIHIQELKVKNIKDNEDINNKYNNKIKSLKRGHFESMLPGNGGK